MKKIMTKVVTVVLFVCVFVFAMTSCSADHMNEVNTDPTKTLTTNPNNLLTTAMLQTYGDFDMMDTYRCYITGFTQYYSGGYNVSTFAGQNMYDNEYSRKMWDKIYGVGLKNVVQGIEDSKIGADDLKSTTVNINAALRIYRVYLLSLIIDTYGDAPCTEAGYAAINGKLYPKYDSQQEAYDFFFSELADAIQQFDENGDRIIGDVSSMNGDIKAWKKFANSLRMRYAMRISEKTPEKAQAEFEAALSDPNGFVDASNSDVLIRYLNKPFTFYQGATDLDFRVNALGEMLYGQDPTSPTLICKTLYDYLLGEKRDFMNPEDPRLDVICRHYLNPTRSEVTAGGCYDVTDELKAWGMAKRADDPETKAGPQPNEPGEAWWCNWPTIPDNADIPTLERLVREYPNAGFDQNNYPARMTRPFLNIAFEQPDCPGVVITYTEMNFLLAEAVLKGWITDASLAQYRKTTEEYFEAGVNAAFAFLNANYNINPISDVAIKNYYQAKYGNKVIDKEDINYQAWIHHLTNPVEGYANLRRSDYPVLRDRRLVPTETSMKLGEPQDQLLIPVRLRYPMLEEQYNSESYNEAVTRQAPYSWHQRVWWDVADINVK